MKLKLLVEGVRITNGNYQFDYNEDKFGDLLKLRSNSIHKIQGKPLYYGFAYSEVDDNVEQQDISKFQIIKKVLVLIDKIQDEYSQGGKLDEDNISGGYGYSTRVNKVTHDVLKLVKGWGRNIPEIDTINIDRRFNNYAGLIDAVISEIYEKYPDAINHTSQTLDTEMHKSALYNAEAIKGFKKLITDFNSGIRRNKISQDDVDKFIDFATDNVIKNLGVFDLVVYPQSKSAVASRIALSLANKLGVKAVNGFEKVKLSFDYEKYKSDYIAAKENNDRFAGPWPIDSTTQIWSGGRLIKSLGDLLNNDKAIKATGLFPWAKPYIKSQQLSDNILSHLNNDSNVIVVDDVYHSGETLLNMTNELSDIVSGTVVGYALVKI